MNLGAFPPTSDTIRQELAHSPYGCILPFDSDAETAKFGVCSFSPRKIIGHYFTNRYPSPSQRPDPPRIRPQLLSGSAKTDMLGIGTRLSPRSCVFFALIPAHKIKNGGLRACGNYFHSLQSRRSLDWPPVVTQTWNAARQARSSAAWAQWRLTSTRLQVRRSVRPLAFCATTLRTSADLIGLADQTKSYRGVAGQTPRGAASVSGTRGNRACSRKS